MSNELSKLKVISMQRNLQRIINEEIDAKYGNDLTKKQKSLLEAGIVQAVKGTIGNAVGAGVDLIKNANASRKLGPAIKKFKDLISKTHAAGIEVANLSTAAKKPAPPELEKFFSAFAPDKKQNKTEGAKNIAPASITNTASAQNTGGTNASANKTVTGKASGTPAIGESRPVAINKGSDSLQNSLFKLAAKEPEKKKQVIGVLKALGGDLKNGKIPINEAATGLVNLKNTAAALRAITDPAFFKLVKSEVVKILNNVKTKVNISQIQSVQQVKAPATTTPPAAATPPPATTPPATTPPAATPPPATTPPAATPPAATPPAATPPAATPPAATPPAAIEESETNKYNESLRRKYRFGLISLNEYNIKRRR